MSTFIHRVAVYARLSVSTEESVSIARQVESARQYAAARGWEVVLVATDDGVSATKNRPEDRPGWRKILDSPEHFQAVIVWKLDRLARRVLDFLNADAALQHRGAGIVAVEDPVDMTTAQGRAFATMLAVFGEMEAAAIAARVKAARRQIIAEGRRAGGRPPFGWRNVPNPDGPGMVLAKDPDRIGYVVELADRAVAGASLYSLTKWLDGEVPPRDREGRRHDYWHEAGVEAILRNPVLAGMVPFTPGRKPGEPVRVDVLRDRDGMPVVDESVAIMSPDDFRRLQAVLDKRKAPGSRPLAGAKPSLLAGLVRCGSCGGPLYRSTAAGKYPYFRCQQRGCASPVGVSRTAVEDIVVGRFLAAWGALPVVRFEEFIPEDPAPRLAEVEAAIADTLTRMTEDDADVAALAERLAGLKAVRARAREEAAGARPEVRATATGKTFAEAWAEVGDDVPARRELLESAIAAVYVAPTGKRGNRVDPSRVTIVPHEGRNVDAEDGESTSPESRAFLADRYGLALD